MKGSNDENEKLNCKKEENVSNNLLASGNSGKSGLPSSLNEINLRIREASKDSRFTAAQERKAVELEAKVSHQRDQLKAALSQPQMVRKARRMVDAVLGEFEGEQMLQFLGSEEFCWVCVDMDAFFAAVECLDAPELRNVPMAVGSSAMLSTSNYAARKFGVSAAIPGYIAKQLCPELRIVPLRYERYRELSGQVSCVLHEYDPELSMWSLDEAVLLMKRERVCGEGESFGSVVERMRKQVYETTGLTCSAGIACNPLLAKLASNYRKPDGQFEIERTDPEQMRNFLHEQPVHKLTGIGKVMALTLEKLWNVKSIGDLYRVRYQLPLVFKEKTLKSLLAKSIGHVEDSSVFESFSSASSSGSDVQKSLSCERTFQPPTSSVSFLRNLLRDELVESLVRDLQEMGVSAVGRVGIKVKTSDFRVYTRERQIKLSLHEDASNNSNINASNNASSNANSSASNNASNNPCASSNASCNDTCANDSFKMALMSSSEKILEDFIGEDCEGNGFEIRLLGLRLSQLTTVRKRENEAKKRPGAVLDRWLDAQSSSTMKCPVCSCVLKDSSDLGAVNAHIDECLTKETVKDIVSTSFIDERRR